MGGLIIGPPIGLGLNIYPPGGPGGLNYPPGIPEFKGGAIYYYGYYTCFVSYTFEVVDPPSSEHNYSAVIFPCLRSVLSYSNLGP